MTRRECLAAVTYLGLPRLAIPTLAAQQTPADLQLQIGPVTLEIALKKMVHTVGYNGQIPGPLVRFREGQTVTVEVTNQTADAELLHWHGFHISPEADGAMEEGTPMIPAKGRQRYAFRASPAGTRWYHSHLAGGRSFQKSTYSGQFGVAIIEPNQNPAPWDQDVPLLLHEWEPSVVEDEVAYKAQTINGKMLGSGEPVRVKTGQRILFRMVNCSATMVHRLALAGHHFLVIALDGNNLPAPRTVPVVELGPGERADCVVELNNPGVWILGETRNPQREAGMGIVVEYAGAQGLPLWAPPRNDDWDYTAFGGPEVLVQAQRIPLQFKSHGTHGWTINGKAWPRTDHIPVRVNQRYRLIFDNQSSLAHPLHLHRHTFEITRFAGKPTSGVTKDVVMVPAWKEVEVDLVASNPGLSLLHCHNQFHMDQGFMTLLEYRD
jgi:FtsP/CotA-like multicopper oxidase with cupredoxin domain